VDVEAAGAPRGAGPVSREVPARSVIP
jgi:hypothetical protein